MPALLRPGSGLAMVADVRIAMLLGLTVIALGACRHGPREARREVCADQCRLTVEVRNGHLESLLTVRVKDVAGDESWLLVENYRLAAGRTSEWSGSFDLPSRKLTVVSTLMTLGDSHRFETEIDLTSARTLELDYVFDVAMGAPTLHETLR